MSTGPYGPAETLPPAVADVLAAVLTMVRRALSDYGEWTDTITPNARLDADLGMESVELAALQAQLTQRWGAAGDLTDLLRPLDLAGLAGLTVAAVAGWVAGRTGAAP